MHRDQILDAAFDILPKEGAPKPARVAFQAGVSKALVFHHFKTVEGLHDAMAERILRETQEGLDALARDFPNPRERLEALAGALIAEPPEPPLAALQVLRFWLEDDGRGNARASLRDALVADFVRATVKEARSNTDGAKVAALLLSRWHGTTAVYASGTPVDFEAEEQRTLADLRTLV